MLSEKNVLILDGGFATTLEMMGHTLDKRSILLLCCSEIYKFSISGYGLHIPLLYRR